MINRRALAPLAVLGVIALAGCAAPAPEEAAYDYDYIDMGAQGEITAAGTALKFGDAAWFDGPTNDGEDAFEIGVTVRDVFAADEGFMTDAVSNPEDFTEYTPYIIIVQQHLDQKTIDELNGMRTIELQPMLADGTPGSFVTTMSVGKSDACGVTLPEWDNGEDFLTCVIGLAEEGQEITGALYNDIAQHTVVLDPENPYQTSPVTWAAKG